MRNFLILSLFLFSIQQAHAAHYNFSQLFDADTGVSIVGSFDVVATSGIVNQSQISNFSFIPLIGWGSNETHRQITFNITTKQLDIFIRTSDSYFTTDPSSDPENPQTVQVTRVHSYFANATGGQESYSCSTEPFIPISECSHLSNVDLYTEKPINVTEQIVALPGAFGLFSFALALTGFVQRRSKKFNQIK